MIDIDVVHVCDCNDFFKRKEANFPGLQDMNASHDLGRGRLPLLARHGRGRRTALADKAAAGEELSRRGRGLGRRRRGRGEESESGGLRRGRSLRRKLRNVTSMDKDSLCSSHEQRRRCC